MNGLSVQNGHRGHWRHSPSDTKPVDAPASRKAILDPPFCDAFQRATGVANPRVSRPTRAAQTVIAGDYGLTTASIAWIPHAGGF